METYSYHIFYFPFKWELRGDEDKLFTEQIDLERIPLNTHSFWERIQYDPEEKTPPMDAGSMQEKQELFGELQYYFDFVHPVLYDKKGEKNPIIFHFERKEPKSGNVEYHITVNDRKYILQVEAINVNLYSTGVGILSFYLANHEENQKDEISVRDINQFGRRIMPPHSGEFDLENRSLLAKSIVITGLEGESFRYQDFFDYKTNAQGDERGLSHTWKPAVFIDSLIKDLSTEMRVTPVIDDRMLVNCWFGDKDLAESIKKDNKNFVSSDLWYQYVFIDNGKEATCMNQDMKKELLENSTYQRWQEKGTLYGITRYSLVSLTDRSWFSTNILAMHMRTIYSRMFELIIIQRASILRFSSEVTKFSCLSKGSRKILAERISSLYREYIRFVNQIYFRSVTAQDQGIEIYDMMMKQFLLPEKIKDLDDEIGELHQYATLLIDQKRNENGEWLNKLAACVIPATIMTGLLGMNSFEDSLKYWLSLIAQIGLILIASFGLYHFLINKKIK